MRKWTLGAAAAVGLIAAAVGAQSPDVSDEELSAFVDAAAEVAEIRSDAMEKLAASEDDAERADLIAEANAEMARSVESIPGISVERYNEIVVASQNDPDLAERIAALMETDASGG